MKTILIADVHLKAAKSARQHRDAFARFLDSVPAAGFTRFICLGDLFDFWFEYRHVIFSDFFGVLGAFARMRDAGIEMHLVCGNHDFWAGRFLENELGFHVHRDPTILPFGERRVLLAHGDGVNPHDRAYRLFKRIARNPLVIGAFRLIHPDLAMYIARAVSHGSRTMLQADNPAEGPEAQAIRAWARGVIARGEADTVICGHAHAQCLEQFERGTYINTGDWMRHRCHVAWDGGEFTLHDGDTLPPTR